MGELMPTQFEAEPIAHPRGVAILVTGILWVTFVPVLGPVAWGLGQSALREIDSEPSHYTNRTIVQVGMILGIVATVFLIVGLVLVVTIIVWATTGSGVKNYQADAVAIVIVSALNGG